MNTPRYPEPMWLEGTPAGERFVAFRTTFTCETAGVHELLSSGSGPYRVFVDGALADEGPVRARAGISAFSSVTLEPGPGAHTLAVLVHHEGIATRILELLPAHLRCGIRPAGADGVLPLHWRACELSAYRRGTRRINPELGWIDWCDTRELPPGWTAPGFDDTAWEAVAPVLLDGWQAVEGGIGHVPTTECVPERRETGFLSERYGYEQDDPPARFFLRSLTGGRVAGDPSRDPSQGVWLRFDAGLIALYSPVLDVDLPAGAVVELAYCEELVDGRVNPFVTLSLGRTCNLDHFIVRGGRQRIAVSGYRGGRYLEVHVLYPDGEELPADSAAVAELVFVRLRRRTSYPERSGALETGDTLLDRIWVAGADTLAACSEDAVDDCPTRERGQWLGDVVTVGAAIAGAAFSDLRPFRKALIDAALSAREDGMVAGLCPGTVEHIPSYGCTWTEGVLTYLDLSGDPGILSLLYGAMVENVEALLSYLHEDGMRDGPDDRYPLGWVFVDWGYVPNDGPADMVLTMHLLNAVRSALRWHALVAEAEPSTGGGVGPVPDADRAIAALLPARTPDPTWVTRLRAAEEQIVAMLRGYLDSCLVPDLDWDRLGYHRAVLAVRHRLLSEDELVQVLPAIRAHQDRCFPNDPAAPRNDSPFKQQPRLITPYFYNYAMPVFAEAGDVDYVLEQYRTCWGWLLDGGHSTLCEVFDRRWSQCHQWSGSPTWQLSRYILGLAPEFSRGVGVYRFAGCAHPFSARGRLPIAGREDGITIRTEVRGGRFEMELETPVPVTILPPESARSRAAAGGVDDHIGIPVDALRCDAGNHRVVIDLETGAISPR